MRRWSRLGTCDASETVELGLTKVVGLFAMLVVAYVLASVACAVEAITTEPTKKKQCKIDLRFKIDQLRERNKLDLLRRIEELVDSADA